MRLIYTQDGFSKTEKEEWRIVMFENILDALRLIIDAMDVFEIEFDQEATSVTTFLEQSVGLVTDGFSRCTYHLSSNEETCDHSNPYQSSIYERSRTFGLMQEFKRQSTEATNMRCMTI